MAIAGAQAGAALGRLCIAGRVWHHVVRFHRVALMALVDEQGRVLLVRRHRLAAGPRGSGRARSGLGGGARLRSTSLAIWPLTWWF